LKSWLLDRLAGKKADAVRLPGLQLSCAGAVQDNFMVTLQQLHDRVWLPHCAAGDAAGATAGGSDARGSLRAAAAAACAGQGSGAAATQAASGDRVMMLYYSI
jgi:hypothetical protein